MMAVATYALLLAITMAYVVLVRSIRRRTRDVSVPIAAAILYLWTFLGAWFFIGDAATGYQGYRIGLNYYYLMDKMFPFRLDGDYVLQLLAYAVFTFSLFGALRMFAPAPTGSVSGTPVSREVLAGTGAAFFIVAIWAILPAIREALAQHRAIYLVLHEWSGPRKTLHAFCASAASTAFVFGHTMRNCSRVPDAPFTEKGRWLPSFTYAAGALVMCIYLSMIGDRHTLFGALMLGVIHLLNVRRRGGLKPTFVMFAVGGLALLLGGSLRGRPLSGPGPAPGIAPAAEQEGHFRTPGIEHVPRHPDNRLGRWGEHVLSNEMFCAHFSFQGILQRHVAPDPGISFRYLAQSFKPATERPLSVYELYAREAHLVAGQGYTIHHASAWYLNLGWAGPPVGGLVLGGVWLLLMRAGHRFRAKGWPVLLPWLFVAFLPLIVRSGPEAFKSLLFEGLLLPLIALLPAFVVGARTRAVHHD